MLCPECLIDQLTAVTINRGDLKLRECIMRMTLATDKEGVFGLCTWYRSIWKKWNLFICISLHFHEIWRDLLFIVNRFWMAEAFLWRAFYFISEYLPLLSFRLKIAWQEMSIKILFPKQLIFNSHRRHYLSILPSKRGKSYHYGQCQS